MAGVEYARYDTAQLKDIDETYYLGAECTRCRRTTRLDPARLAAILGPYCPLTQLRRALICEGCKSKSIVITFLAPDQLVGNLRTLLEQKPI